jgi:hypothetical protein
MNEMLKDRLRQALMERATLGSPTSYKALADRLGLVPPQTIHRICEALEILMEEDVAAGRPMLIALYVSKTGANMPAQGFFLKARLLGVFSAVPGGADAEMFHREELERALSFYGAPTH